MPALSSKFQNRPMNNRAAADYLAYGPRSFSPALQNLDPEQRLRLAKSSQKIGKMLGQMPTIDVMPASPGAYSIASTTLSSEPVQPLTIRKKGGKSKRKGPPPPAPILRYRLPPVNTWNILVEEVSEADLAPPRRPIPAALDLASPAGTLLADNRQYVFPYAYMKTPLTPEYLSPLTPLSPLSPIKTPDIHEHRMQTLRRLARMSRAFRNTVIDELALPSVNVVATPEGLNVKTYLDLYRMSVCPRPRSQMPSAGRRRSRSVGGEVKRLTVLSVYSASSRTSFIIPSPNPGARGDRQSHIIALGFPAPATPSPAQFAHPLPRTPLIMLDTPPVPARLRDDSPLQQQQSVAQAKAVILGADAQFMESFRRGFQIRTRRRQSGKQLPTTPTTPRTAGAPKSPKVPYWVRSASRGHVSAGGSRRRRVAASRPPPTPRTMRKERRQGWGGEWRKMGGVVEKLKEMEAAAKAKADLEAKNEADAKAQADLEVKDEGEAERKAEKPDTVDKIEEPTVGPAAVDKAEERVVVSDSLADVADSEDESLLAYLQETDVYSGIVVEAVVVEAYAL
ncbi:hypothetical protein C2E23DRAFT_840459 [Lenzites betulinus]|nr:hypothetical protein C2E23DRAFT_840459 [Lenzites betulinus]